MGIELSEKQRDKIGIVCSIIIIAVFVISVLVNGFLNYRSLLCFIICWILYLTMICLTLIGFNEIKNSRVKFLFLGSLSSFTAYVIATYLALIALNRINNKYDMNMFYLIATIIVLLMIIGSIKSLFQIFQTVMSIKHTKDFENIEYILKHIEKSSGAQYSIEQLKQIEEKKISFDIPYWHRDMANDYLDIMLLRHSGIVKISADDSNKITIKDKRTVNTVYLKRSIVEYVRRIQLDTLKNKK